MNLLKRTKKYKEKNSHEWIKIFHFQDWKTGKRRIEKDDFREASWLQCVTIVNSGLSDTQMYKYLFSFLNFKKKIFFEYLVYHKLIHLANNNQVLKTNLKISVKVYQNILNGILKFMNAIFNELVNYFLKFILLFKLIQLHLVYF